MENINTQKGVGMRFAAIQLGYTTFSDACDTASEAIEAAQEWIDEPDTDIPDYIPHARGRGLVHGQLCIVNDTHDIWSDYIDKNGKAKT
jgi:hypothetical protein